MVIDGISTNRVEKIVEKLSPDLSFSKSTVETTNLIEGVLNKALKQRSYACLRLMEIDEDWQTGRKYMKMIEDEDSDTDEDLMKEITKLKQETNSKKELVVC